MYKIVTRQYNPEYIYKTDPKFAWDSIDIFKSIPVVERKRFRLIYGHMLFGFHEFLSHPYTYVALLRDPIDRIISYYYYILRTPDHYLYDHVTHQQMSLNDLMIGGVSKEFDNLQTRLLSGRAKIPFGQCSTKTLERAKQNLLDNFGVIGITERFDEALILMKMVLGWKNLFYVKQNVTINRLQKKDISEDTLAIIAKHNVFDLELYSYAKEIFEHRIQLMGGDFNNEVQRFKKLNKIYQKIFPLIHLSWRVNKKIGLVRELYI